ncbi:tRNA-guanine transglycosylase [Haladaptatus sp. YSMS36]|uniref:tRNA-guanine transglycosylase n=1 Tax=Haladaptatus sp. YSMS36 TaxID=3033384 RepID=UPI0023E89F65|nr:tRNA-guanine transglycosylase [Haladaptatus sp. YSMS36]
MSEFRVEKRGKDGYGRLGTLDVPNGPVDTPALFPVINLIGGTTVESGGVWRRMRDKLISSDHLQGIMFQAMSFTDYGVSSNNLNEFWRTKTFHERFDDLNAPVFIDSGGFKLMNSDTFGDAPEEGGAENDWGIYTNPESILGLQMDFGADIIATLDYPIPPKLNDAEKVERMERSIESAVECLKLLEDPSQMAEESLLNDTAKDRLLNRKSDDDLPGVYVALHGHDYETVNWYVANFLERIESENVSQSFEGFAIGSLVPLRSSVDVLVDIVQGARDAIPDDRVDDIGLHVFGVGGKQVGLLSLLGADSFDCSSHMLTSRYKKYLIPETWEHVKLDELEPYLTDDGEFPCTLEHCTLCGPNGSTTFEKLHEELNLKLSYQEREARKKRGEWIKSDYYAALARHNFEVYNEELKRVRNAIADGHLLEYVCGFALDHPDIKAGLKQAQIRDKQLRHDIKNIERLDEIEIRQLLIGQQLRRDQSQLSKFFDEVDEISTSRSISLKYGPNDFNILRRREKFNPPAEKDVLLFVPCSQKKPYSQSRTHSILSNKLGSRRDRIHKITVSGMYGPVPEEKETEDPVLRYEYVLAKEDEAQQELVTNRLVKYLDDYGNQYDHILAYVASSTYRQVIEDALDEYGRGTVFPKNPRALKLTEHFRNSNIQQLLDYLDEHPQKE